MLTDPGTMRHSRKSKHSLNSYLLCPLTPGVFVQVVWSPCILWAGYCKNSTDAVLYVYNATHIFI